VELKGSWWKDKQTLNDVYRQYNGNLSEAARQIGGVTVQTLSKWWLKHGNDPQPGGRKPQATPHVGAPDDEAVLRALAACGDEGTIEQVADAADLSPRRVREALERLGHDGYRIEETETQARLKRFPTDTAERHTMSPRLFDGDVMRFGVVSDTHLGSDAERPEAIDVAYDIFEQEGIGDVFHVGDLVDGLGIYRTHNTEVKLHTYESQVNHATDVFPSRPSIHTRIIGGNHDLEGDFGKAGADPVQAVCNRRDDMTYLGRYSAEIELPNGATLQMLHPQGGASYATSYKPQKIAESYEGGTKPNVLLIGHWHRTGYFPVRGIQILMAGTFQGPTTFSIRKAMGSAGWGFWIVDCRLADDGSVVRFKPEWLPFYPGRSI
jgi:predicted phosphodiesterase/transposase-like protein